MLQSYIHVSIINWLRDSSSAYPLGFKDPATTVLANSGIDIKKKKPETIGPRFLISKVGSACFPLIWYETLITKSIPKVLGITAGFQAVIFERYHSFLILYLSVLFVVYLSLLIVNIFETDKKLYYQLDNFFLQNEIKLHGFSYWETFKQLYINWPKDTKLNQTSATNSRKYSTTSSTSGPILNTIKGVVGKKMIGLGGKLAPPVVSKAAPAAANSSLTISGQGLTAMGTGTLAAVGVAGSLVMTGGDQAMRYCVENGMNSMTQPDHKWPPFKMQPPADVWIHGSKK